MSSLTLNGKQFAIEELKNISVDSVQTEFEKSTLRFCQAWLNGQQEFKIHTSGSTGTPKEIILKRSAMEASALQTVKALKLKTDDTALVCLDTKYIAGQMMLVRCLVNVMNIIAVEPSANPLDSIKDLSVDFTALVPYQLENILEHSSKEFDRITCAIIGGAAISNSLKEKIRKSECSIYASYGMTETISHIALQKLNGADAQEYFDALENIQLRLDDRGCLCIKADYLGDEVVTNDLVELIDSKKFKWLGRVDNVINSGGVKVIPEKVEALFEKIFDSLKIKNRFFVAGLADEKLGQQVVVILEEPFLEPTTLERIKAEASRLLAKYELPKEFKFVRKFSETDTGKIKRSDTLAMLKSEG